MLERIRIMKISLKGVLLGEWRDLTDDELIELFKLIENSFSEDNSKAKRPAQKARPAAAKKPAAKAADKPTATPAGCKRFFQ
ncbi:23S rRNA pseudouridine(2604) synthase RluF, partial [Candidatus Erwinia dacicola]|nr:23S rRNA pseudouridine(2604) synthase RluF [Candidatus Erwinia dacicola]